MAAPAVEVLDQGLEAGGLAGLTRGVEDEVLLAVDRPEDAREVDASEGVDAGVESGEDHALSVEKALLAHR